MITRIDMTVVFENENNEECARTRVFRGETLDQAIESMRVWFKQNDETLSVKGRFGRGPMNSKLCIKGIKFK